MKLYFHLLSIAVALASCCMATASVAQERITPDGTLSTLVRSPDGVNFTISGGNRAGGNIFHSFSQFSVPTGGSAFFNNSPDIVNIIGRVTGGAASTIDGLLRANGTANLFLLNPNGIIFGAGARLDIGGSFLASTANAVKFADGTEFSANATLTPPLLTISVPIGLQYNGTAAGIEVQGANLAVQPERTLALAGGNIRVVGGMMSAEGGHVELGGVAGAGTIGLTLELNQGNKPVLSFPNNVALSDILLEGGTNIATTGGGGGNIQLIGRQIKLQNSRVEANTLGSTPGGNLNVFASDTVEIAGLNAGGTFSNGLFAENSGSGAGTNLTITTRDLLVTGDARISTANFGVGKGGNLTVNATGTINLIGIDPPNDDTLGTLFTGLLTDTHGAGLGGNLTINTGKLIVQNGAQISAATYGTGNGGNLTVKATQEVQLLGVTPSDLLSSGLFTAVQPGATGNAGNLIVDTKQLVVRDGAQIFTGTAGAGNGGNLIANATDSIELSGTSPIFFALSGLYSTATQGSTGSAGDLTVNTGRFIVKDGAQVNAVTGGTGRVGTLQVQANSVELRGVEPLNATNFDPIHLIPSGLFSSVQNPSNFQNAGSVEVNTGQLIVQGGAKVSVNNRGTGNGGSINIGAGSIVIDNAGNPNQKNPGGIQATTASGEGGNINLQAPNLLLIRHGGAITTNAQGGSGNGGNITINTDVFAALENSNTTANAIQGNGGNINITTQGLFFSRNSQLTASSQLGINGQVNVNTPAIDPNKGLVVLPTRVFSIEGLVAQRCSNGARLASRFTVTGRGGLPANPSEGFESETILSDWGNTATLSTKLPSNPRSAQLEDNPPAQLVEARGWFVNNNGEVVLTATPPEFTPHSPWITPASCQVPTIPEANSNPS